MKNFFYDLKYLISKENTTSRGFYLAVTIASVIFYIVSFVSIILAIVGVIGKISIIFGLLGILLPTAAWVLLVKFT